MTSRIIPRSSRDRDYVLGSLSTFPQSIDTAISLRTASNDAVTSLYVGATASAKWLNVRDASRFPAVGVVRVDDELIYYSGKSGNKLMGLVRGWAASPTTRHSEGAAVSLVIEADHHNAVRDAIQKVQAKAGLISHDEEMSSLTGRLQLMFKKWGNPEASFRASARRGHPPFTVSFQDTSRGFPRLFKWDFGDGNVSFEREPIHVYSQPGTYDVTLEIFTQSAGYSRRKSIGYVEVVDPRRIVDVAFCVRIPEPVNPYYFATTPDGYSADSELQAIFGMMIRIPSEELQADIAAALGLREISFDGIRRVVTENGVRALLDAASLAEDPDLERRISDLGYYIDAEEFGPRPTQPVDPGRYDEDDGSVLVPIQNGKRVVFLNEEIEFIDQTAGEIVAREWGFGDGTSASVGPEGWKIRHTYETVGTYSPVLAVRAADGTTASGKMLTAIEVIER